MARNSKSASRAQLGFVEVKSKFDAEFRRFSVTKDSATQFEDFHKLVQVVHKLEDIPFVLNYTDPSDGDLLPINNDDNYRKALTTAKPLLRLLVQKRGESEGEFNGYGTLTRKKNAISRFIQGEVKMRNNLSISMPGDFRRVSAIIDVDIVPETHRRVKLMKNGSDKPLGFYIRDGTSVRVTPHGLEKVPGIFISRLVPGGLAESTGLLAVNDEVIEVNGIEVAGKTLDQATDMMVANSSNLIVTVKPVNQRNNISPRETLSRVSQKSAVSIHSTVTTGSDDLHEIDEEEDVVRDYLSNDSPASKELVQKDPKTVLKSDPAHNPTAEKTDVKDEKPKADRLKTDKEDQDSAVVAL